MVCKQGNLTVQETAANLDIDNGRVLVRLFLRDGGYAQEFHAIDQTGIFQPILSSLHKTLMTSSEHRVCASPMIAGERPHLFGISRESLRMVYSKAVIVEHSEEIVKVRLSGNVQDHSLNSYITVYNNDDHVHISVDDEIASDDGPPLVEYLMSSFVFLPGASAVTNRHPIDYTWSPIMRPGKDHLIGDCAFSSPAVIVQQKNCSAALIPDLCAVDEYRPMPTALDLDLTNGLLFAPLISYGFCGYKESGLYCKHDVTMSCRLDPPRLSYSYDLLISANCKRKSAYRQVSRFLWNTYGAKAIRQPRTQSQSSRIQKSQLQTPDYDPHTGMRYQNGRDLLESARTCMDLYENNAKIKHLTDGLKILDQLCLLQRVWPTSWNQNATLVGLCAASNAGWEQDPIFSAEFAKCALQYGALTGDRYYFERGTAALQAALNLPGLDVDSQKQIQACANLVRSKYGSIYIHIGKEWGACNSEAQLKHLKFSSGKVSMELTPHPGANGHRRVFFGGMKRLKYNVCIDGKNQSYLREEMAEGIAINQ